MASSASQLHSALFDNWPHVLFMLHTGPACLRLLWAKFNFHQACRAKPLLPFFVVQPDNDSMLGYEANLGAILLQAT